MQIYQILRRFRYLNHAVFQSMVMVMTKTKHLEFLRQDARLARNRPVAAKTPRHLASYTRIAALLSRCTNPWQPVIKNRMIAASAISSSKAMENSKWVMKLFHSARVISYLHPQACRIACRFLRHYVNMGDVLWPKRRLKRQKNWKSRLSIVNLKTTGGIKPR